MEQVSRSGDPHIIAVTQPVGPEIESIDSSTCLHVRLTATLGSVDLTFENSRAVGQVDSHPPALRVDPTGPQASMQTPIVLQFCHDFRIMSSAYHSSHSIEDLKPSGKPTHPHSGR